MLKTQRQEEPRRSLLISCLLLLLICFCILHTFVVFHSHLEKLPISPSAPFWALVAVNGAPKVVLNRGGLMNALREEGRSDSGEIRTRIQVKASYPTLDKPPLNVTEAERIKWFTENYSSFRVLHSDALSSRFQSKVKKFFHGENCKGRFFMTWIAPLKFFGPRELLSIESVFKFHPGTCLLIISRTLDSTRGSKILHPFVARGFRIMATAPDLAFLFKDTPAESWLADVVSGRTDPGEIPFPQNLSNIIRLVALYKYGGTYIDSDVIVLRRLSKLRNAIGAQNVDSDTGAWNRLNNAVLVFDKRHPLLFKFILEFALTFNGNKWGHNGPYLVTRVLNRLANRSNEGFQVQVLPPMAFYPVDWTRIRSYFSRTTDAAGNKWRTTKLLQMEGETYAIHLWNKQSREYPVEEESIIYNIFTKSCIICDYRNFLQGGSMNESIR